MINVNTIIKTLISGQRMATNRVMMKAYKRSAGKYKASTLTKKGHPYSTRNAGGWIPYSDPGIINLQSTEFYFSWRKQDPMLKGNEIVSSVYNVSPYADVLAKGKKSTIPRPLIKGLMPTAEYWQKWWLIRSMKDAINSL